MLMLPGELIVLSVTFRLGGWLTRSAALGYVDIPSIPESQLSPWRHPAALMTALLILIWWWTVGVLAPSTGVVVTVLFAIWLPAPMVLSHVLDGALGGLNPRAGVAFVRQLGPRYIWLIVLCNGWLLVPLALSAWSVGALWIVLASIYAYYVSSFAVGRCLYSRRSQLGLAAEAGVDIEIARSAQAASKRIADLRLRAHRLAAVGKTRAAAELLEAETRAQGLAFGERLFLELNDFEHQRSRLRFGGWLIGQLATTGETETAWSMADAAGDQSEGLFRSGLRLTALTVDVPEVRRAQAIGLLSDFALKYPEDAALPLVLEHLAEQQLLAGNVDAAGQAIRQIHQSFASHAAKPQVRALVARLRQANVDHANQGEH